jgi:hypothetical protein
MAKRARGVSGMLLSALFVWAYWLGAGALRTFGIICLLSGVALGVWRYRFACSPA